MRTVKPKSIQRYSSNTLEHQELSLVREGDWLQKWPSHFLSAAAPPNARKETQNIAPAIHRMSLLGHHRPKAAWFWFRKGVLRVAVECECVHVPGVWKILSRFWQSRCALNRPILGRGPSTHAFTHSVSEDHHIFINMQTLKCFSLPENYEIIDSSLSDIQVFCAVCVIWLFLHVCVISSLWTPSSPPFNSLASTVKMHLVWTWAV